MKLGTLHAAAKAGDAGILRGLIDGGADVNQADARGISALGVAVGFNRLPAVQALLAAGARIDQPDGRGNTVLHYAAGAPRLPGCCAQTQWTGCGPSLLGDVHPCQTLP